MSTSTDYAYRDAEKKRKKDISPDAVGTRIADFIALVVLCIWLFDMACWGAGK